MSRGRQIPSQIDRQIGQLVVERCAPMQIHRQLFPDGTKTPGHVSVRTVRRRVDELRPDDSSGPWSLADADPEEARLVLDVVAEVFFSTDGRVWLSKDHVAEIARLRRVVPAIPSLWADNLARAYRLCKEQGRDSRHLDFALAVRPWGGVTGADQVARALGLPRSFRVLDDVSGPLFDVDSAIMLADVVMFRGSIEDMRSRLESLSNSDPIPDPPDITVVDETGRPLEGSSQHSSTPVPTPEPADDSGRAPTPTEENGRNGAKSG